MKKSLHLLLLVTLTIHPFQPSWGGLEPRVSPEMVRKLTPCALELLIQSTGASFQSGNFIEEWFANHSIEGLSEAEDRLMGLMLTDLRASATPEERLLRTVLSKTTTEAIHIKGREEVSRFLFSWAELVDQQVASPTPPTNIAPSKPNKFAKSAVNLVGAMVFLTLIYSGELAHPNAWKEARFGLMMNMWLAHWCWVDVWRGIKNTKLRMLLTLGSSMLGVTLPAVLIPEMHSGHEITIKMIKEMALIIGVSHAVTATLFARAAKPQVEVANEEPSAEKPKNPTIAVRSRPRDLQVESQGSRNGHYFYVQFEIPGDDLTKQRFLDVILYQGDSALGREPELLIARSNIRPEHIYDEVVRYNSERQADN